MDCSSYLQRIGFVGRPQPNLITLRQLQRAHLQQIPFENLDVQLGRRVTLERSEAFAKLVISRRGGWCYEMNGLFLWVLESIGFRVMPMTAAVRRAERGTSVIGNHLALSVELEQPYLVDVGSGDGPIEPVPLKEGLHRQQWRTLHLERLGDGWWRFHNDEDALAPTFDFQHRPADWDAMGAKCDWLQTSPDSRFVQNAVCLRHLPNGVVALVGRVLKTRTQEGVSERLVVSADDYVETLAATFGIQLPEAAGLWPIIRRRHEVLFAT